MSKQKETVITNVKEEALRYIQNALELLEKAGSEDNEYYADAKYVKTACGTAYNGVLLAVDEILKQKGIAKTKGRKSESYYREQLGKFDRKILNHYNTAYEILHLSGYYDGTRDKKTVKRGFEVANQIIQKV
jgi:hypothetical protein